MRRGRAATGQVEREYACDVFIATCRRNASICLQSVIHAAHGLSLKSERVGATGAYGVALHSPPAPVMICVGWLAKGCLLVRVAVHRP